jgi:gamma-glutamylcyclotransferase
MPARTIHYFAYGSNMYTPRMAARVPSCRALGLAQAAGFSLRFHKLGRDGSGKCDAYRTLAPRDCVLGVLFQIALEHKRRLDRIEGIGAGYWGTVISVMGPEGLSAAYTYTADARFMDATLKPFPWYKALVLAGAREHGLPPIYVEAIARVGTTADVDVERSRTPTRAGPRRRRHDPPN